MDYKLLEFRVLGDSRGSLVALENSKEVPFDVKRVYYIFNTGKDVTRGLHAHRELKQVLICVNGSCTIRLDDGKETKQIVLDSPTTGLYLGGMIWREMSHFSEGAVLLVLASNFFSEDEYIRDYDQFLREVYR